MVRAILDFPGSSPAMSDTGDTRLAFHTPVQVLATSHLHQVRRTMRDAVAAARGRWAVGFVTFEAAPAFDAALTTRAPRPGLPLVWFAVFDAPDPAAAAADGAAGDRPVPAEDGAGGTRAVPAWRTPTLRQDYDAAVATIRDGIAAGDVYQVNHTLRFGARLEEDPRTLYERLVRSRHGVYHAFIEAADFAIVSASPELFLDIRAGLVTTRPMKGTMRRGRWLEEDEEARRQLAASAKDRAENLMIVDLLRNDLGRVARFGSVAVPSAFDVETYPTVHQLTSTVTAQLRDDVALDDVFAATFPCGSVTGAPKVTSMRAIADLEDSPRGVYCGAIGVLRPDGSATFNVAIRTVTADLRTGDAEYGSGGGITWDSRADAEYDELVAKAALLTDTTPAFDLLETMRMDDGVIRRLDLHLRRLHESALYWRFSTAVAEGAREALDRCARDRPRGAWRVRLTAARDGVVTVDTGVLRDPERGPDDDAAPACVVIAARAVSRRDRLLFHKTTARAIYDAHRAAHPDAFDVLLFNEDGEVTEFTIGNVVADLDGTLITPPRACGLLAGCMRADLLERGVVREAVLTIDEARRARRLWLINSVRGWVPVRLA